MSLTRWQCEFAKPFVSLFSVVDAEAKGPSGTCDDAAELAVLFSPTVPRKGAPLRVVFAADLSGRRSPVSFSTRMVANTPGSSRRHF